MPLIALAGCVPPFTAPAPTTPPASTADTGPAPCASGCRVDDEAASTWFGEGPDAWAGDALAPVGRLGDDRPDLLVGSKGLAGGAGATYLLVDQEAPTALPLTVAALKLRWRDGEDSALGAAVVGLVDADGAYAGAALGAPHAYDEVGAVWVVTAPPPQGQQDLDLGDGLSAGAPGIEQWVGAGADGRAGLVLDAGDLDGDGHAELLVGSLGTEARDGAWIVDGRFSGQGQHALLTESRARFLGAVAGDQGGCSVLAAGDLDGTGVSTVVVGSCRADAGSLEDAGAITLVEGPIGSDHTLGFDDRTVFGAEAGDQLGVALRRAGDVDGDGLDDLLVGSHSCGLDPTGASCDARAPGEVYGRGAWWVIAGSTPDPATSVDDVGALRIELPDSHGACNGADAGRFAGDPDGVDLAFGWCADDAGVVAVLADAAPTGRWTLPDDADAFLLLTGLAAGDLAGAEVRADGAGLTAGAWQADATTGIDAGAVYRFGPLP